MSLEKRWQLLSDGLSSHIYSVCEIVNDGEEKQLAGMQAKLGEVVEERESEVLED